MIYDIIIGIGNLGNSLVDTSLNLTIILFLAIIAYDYEEVKRNRD